MLDFRMETFLEVCKDMNFTKTARRLNMTQPAVSQHIHWLEEAYGTRLFSYQGKKMSLTPAGEMLKNSAATMSHDILLLREKMQESTRKKRELKIGLTLTIAEFEAAKSMARYLNENETYSMLLSVGNTRELLKELEEGKIDFALVEGNFPRDIYHHQLYATEPYIAVCAADDPLSRGRHTIDELLGRRLVTREAGSGTRNILERYLEMKSLEVTDFSALVEAGSIGLIKQLVEYGCGITFLYRMAVKRELEEGRLCEIKMDDMNITHDFTFIWREGSIFHEDYQKIYQMLKKSRDKSTEERK
ncbi:MAG: LysR family transcriptional regulator [Blautia sp.]|nr:LysR family transcriptional regulator [Blautia sp.]